MRKQITLAAMLMLLAIVVTSCGDKKSEWTNYYGYTNEDIIGEYSYSNNADAFYGLEESEYCHLCPDAEISISKLSDKTVKFKINCPEAGFSREFIGSPRKFKDDFMVQMRSNYFSRAGSTRLKAYFVTSYVSTNDNQDIHLHGFASYKKFKVEYPVPADSTVVDTVLVQATNYYFDVIKD